MKSIVIAEESLLFRIRVDCDGRCIWSVLIRHEKEKPLQEQINRLSFISPILFKPFPIDVTGDPSSNSRRMISLSSL